MDRIPGGAKVPVRKASVEELQRFYERVAHDEAFCEALWRDPDGTIDSTDLPAHVKAMLKSVSRERLTAMVRKATGMKPPLLATIGKVALGIGAVAVGAALLLPDRVPPGMRAETRAARYLHEIAVAEQQYKEQYGTFGAIEDMARFEEGRLLVGELLQDDFPYEFTITAEGDTYTAIARHKTRPDTRKAFVVGPDGAVRELKPDDPAEE